LLTYFAALVGRLTADLRFDSIQFADPTQGFTSHKLRKSQFANSIHGGVIQIVCGKRYRAGSYHVTLDVSGLFAMSTECVSRNRLAYQDSLAG